MKQDEELFIAADLCSAARDLMLLVEPNLLQTLGFDEDIVEVDKSHSNSPMDRARFRKECIEQKFPEFFDPLDDDDDDDSTAAPDPVEQDDPVEQEDPPSIPTEEEEHSSHSSHILIPPEGPATNPTAELAREMARNGGRLSPVRTILQPTEDLIDDPVDADFFEIIDNEEASFSSMPSLLTDPPDAEQPADLFPAPPEILVCLRCQVPSSWSLSATLQFLHKILGL